MNKKMLFVILMILVIVLKFSDTDKYGIQMGAEDDAIELFIYTLVNGSISIP